MASSDLGVIAAGLPLKNVYYPHIYQDGSGWKQIGPKAGFATEVNNAGQVCGAISSTSTKSPDSVFIYDPRNGYLSINNVVIGSDTDIQLWFAGNYANDMVSKGMSEGGVTADGQSIYPIITGNKFYNNAERAFVLTPQYPAP